VKIIIAGATQVGKTSLVNKFVFNQFLDVTPTIGINFAQKISLGKFGPLNMSIWDLSGQTRFRFLMPKFCSGAVGLILVFDQTRPQTLEEAYDWLKLVKEHAYLNGETVIILAGAKSDLPVHVPKNRIDSFCHQHQISNFVPCSAKSGLNVDRVFSYLASAIQQTIQELSTPVLILPEST
jgi:small GTP-binding protein